ncbi:hypothetical protein [uncultured Desulfobulbus sp.]|uniref:hypothetical protein n=1 Tax=uncultured Desulfobulbus sp. TaxID=239745 RepID=UPI0029C8C6D6|nr:hypothetical protein [uncultured Desulfobulbus sp.]
MKTNIMKRIPYGWMFGILFLVAGLGADYEWLSEMKIMQEKPGFFMLVTLITNTLPGVTQLAFAWYKPKHPRKPGDWEVGIPIVGMLIIVAGFLNVMIWVFSHH